MNKILFMCVVAILVSSCGVAVKGDYLENAKSDIAENNLESAINNLKSAILSESNNIDARILLGEIYLREGDTAKALANFDKALDHDATNTKALMMIGKTLLQQGNPKEVLKKIQLKNSASNIDQSNIVGMRAQAYFIEGETELAIQELDKVIVAGRAGKEHYLAKIQLAVGENNLSLAEEMIQDAVSFYPQEKYFSLLSAKVKIEQGKIDEGKQIFEQLMDTGVDSFNAAIGQLSGYELVKLLINQGELESAEKIVKTLLRGYKRDFRSLYYAGLIALLNGKYKLAERRLIKLEKFYTIDSVRLLLGVVFMVNDTYEKARFYLANYYSSNPEDLWAAKLLIRTYIMLKEHTKIKDIFVDLEKSGYKIEDDVDLQILQAMLFVESSPGKAKQYLIQAEQLVGESLDKRNLLSRIYLNIDDNDKSLLHSNYVLSKEPSNVEALKNAFSAYLEDKNIVDIESLLGKFRGAGGNKHLSDNLKGVAYLYNGEYEKSQKIFENILLENTGDSTATINLAKAIELKGDIREAHDRYEAIVAFPANREEGLDGLIRTAYLMGNKKKIYEAIEINRNYDYKSVDPLIFKGAYLIQSGRFKDARSTANEISLLKPGHPGEQVLLAALEYERGNTSDAEKIAGQALASNPSYGPLLSMMAGNSAGSGKGRSSNNVGRTLGWSAPKGGAERGVRLGAGDHRWTASVLPVMGGKSGRASAIGLSTKKLIKLRNSELRTISTQGSGASNYLTSLAGNKNYSYGRKGDLARINRVLFFRFNDGFSHGALSRGEIQRKGNEGIFYYEDMRGVSSELNHILGTDKKWNIEKIKRTLRVPTPLAIAGIFLILFVIAVRWSRRSPKR